MKQNYYYIYNILDGNKKMNLTYKMKMSASPKVKFLSSDVIVIVLLKRAFLLNTLKIQDENDKIKFF
jgi:hypothetical protein